MTSSGARATGGSCGNSAYLEIQLGVRLTRGLEARAPNKTTPNRAMEGRERKVTTTVSRGGAEQVSEE